MYTMRIVSWLNYVISQTPYPKIEALHDCDSGLVERQNNGYLVSPGTYIYSHVKTIIVPAFQHGRCHVVMQSLYSRYDVGITSVYITS